MAARRVFFLDGRPTEEERADVSSAPPRDVIEDPRPPVRLPGQPYYPASKAAGDLRTLTALDADTGRPLWRVPMDLTGMGKEPALICAKGIVLVCANMDASRLAALSADNGRLLWEKKTVYFRRPVVIGDTIYSLPYAHDLRTGKLVTRTNTITGEATPFAWTKAYGCGGLSASKHTMFFRSGSLAYYDVDDDMGVGNVGGLKPSCWVSQIAAGGLWLAPEGSAGCTCGYPIRSSVALRPDPGKKDYWACYVGGIPTTPVKHLALNLGAPGDRRDADGRAWFAWPRPKSAFGLKLGVKTEIGEGLGYFSRNPITTSIQGTSRPWVYCSGCRGMRRCVVHLLDKPHKPAAYTVRMHFVEPECAEAGRRVFDIKLQGRTVARDVDPFAAAGARDKAVLLEFKGVPVTHDLTVELAPKAEDPKREQAPIICGIEAVRETP